MSTIQDIDIEALDALIARLQQAKDYQLTLEPSDIERLISALITLSHLQHKLSDQDITLHKLRKLVGIVRSSEKLKDLLPAEETADQKSESEPSPDEDETQTSRPPRKKAKRPPTPATPPTQEYHALAELSKGERCPECLIGTLNKYEPAVLLRISGHSPYEATRHIMERLRCNACGIYFTAALPEAVQQDGQANQMYAYSARSLMAISKYYMGQPFYRQESLQHLLGLNITASTLFDQCEYVANAIKPVYDMILRLAADAPYFEIDDTPYKILSETEIQKPNRKTGKLQRRTGSNASGLIASLATGQVLILIQTNIGHAGEWIDEILSQRTVGLPAPIVMSDALSSNKTSIIPVIESLCNVHARRQFADITDHFPETVPWVLNDYKVIWKNEDHCQDNTLSPPDRQRYHKTHSLPVMEIMKNRFETHLADEDVEENSGLGKAMSYFLRHYLGLTQFCHTEGARLDNNRMEAELKIPIRNRKNAYFYKTLAGAQVSDVLTSMISTCVQAGVNPFDYLTWVQQHPERVKTSPLTCLPWNYKGVPEKMAA